MKGLLTVLMLISLSAVISGKRTGICNRVPIHTVAPMQQGDGGFSILVKGIPYSGRYIPGETYSVVIKNTDKDKHVGMLGVMLVAVPEDALDETKTAGKFVLPSEHVQKAEDCDSVITHHYLDKKNKIKVDWEAPTSGCVEFRATVISENATQWYRDAGKLTVKLCDEDPSIVQHQGDVPAQRDSPECCACGEARYRMVFEGLWSQQTHPRNFPTGKDAFLLHWSNIVGATHTEDYIIWEYGGYAERGVREVCEYGYSSKLEKDMKINSDKIYTVIKTSPMWRNVLDKREAIFKVNQKAHLVSLLTMVGPSPDWCVGIPSLSVCNANCTWADELVVDLYPWDAGTDNGKTYINTRKIPTDPPERIHRITHTYPTHSDSPFCCNGPIKPMARVTLTKLKEVCGGGEGDSSGEDSMPTTEDLINEMKEKMMINKKLEMMKCATTEWSKWSDCSNNCGGGIRRRSRTLLNENILPSMCSISLSDDEQCEGKCMAVPPRKSGRDKLSDNFEVRHTDEIDFDDPCAITPWSDWSPCSAKLCGRGVRERWRMYLRKSAQSMNCGYNIMEPDVCYGIIPDCRKAFMMKNFTVICSLPKNDGPCRGNFQRWYYDGNMRKCLPFRYGGCRGNDNRFETENECKEHCADYMASQDELKRMMRKKQMMAKNNVAPQLDSTNVDFSMEKKRKMFKRMEKEKKRERRRQMKEKKRLMRAEKMRSRKDRMQVTTESPVPVDCMVTEWTPWEQCTETCGKQYITRQRMIKRQPENGGKKCPKKLSRRKKCRLPKCPKDCKVSSWSDWSSCTATCGPEAVRERMRKILKKPKNNGMDCPSLMERQSCNLAPCIDDSGVKEFMELMQKNPPV
ncbi:Spondin-1 [Mactra antiquata]